MFQTLIYPSSGACDCVVELPHRLSCSQFVVLEIWCGWFWAVFVLQAEACKTNTMHFTAYYTNTFKKKLISNKITINSLTPWSRALEKLKVPQLVKKFPTFYGPPRFITAFTSACHLSLSWDSSIQFIPPNLTSWRSILILSSHLRLGLQSGYEHFATRYDFMARRC